MDVFAGEPGAVDTELVIVTAFENEAPVLSSKWAAPTGGEIDRAIASKEFIGKLFETFLTPIVDRGLLGLRFGTSCQQCIPVVRMLMRVV